MEQNSPDRGSQHCRDAPPLAPCSACDGLILYFTLRKPAIVGCVQSADGTSTLIDERDKRTYALAGNHLNLKVGERLKLKGKKIKEKDGKFTFRVKKVDHDYGACNQ